MEGLAPLVGLFVGICLGIILGYWDIFKEEWDDYFRKGPHVLKSSMWDD